MWDRSHGLFWDLWESHTCRSCKIFSSSNHIAPSCQYNAPLLHATLPLHPPKLDATIPGSYTERISWKSWGEGRNTSWVSRTLVSLFLLITIDFLSVITIVPCKDAIATHGRPGSLRAQDAFTTCGSNIASGFCMGRGYYSRVYRSCRR